MKNFSIKTSDYRFSQAMFGLCAALLAPTTLQAQGAPEVVIPAPRFEIRSFDVNGDRILGAETVQRIVSPFTGQQKDFSDVQRALEALESEYRKRGFGVVQVQLPEQDITRGVVRFNIVQPVIGKVNVEGNQFFNNANVRRSLPSVKEGEIPNSAAIARDLQVVSEHPVKQTNVLLRSGATDSQVDVNVRVTDGRPWRLIATLDDSGTSDTGYMRLGLGFQHTNLFDRDHSFTAQYVTSPTNHDQVAIYGLGYRIPYYRLHSTLDLFAGYSDVDSGTVQGLFNVSGKGSIFGGRWNYHLPKRDDIEHRVFVGLDYRAFQNNVTLGGVGFVPDITIQPVSFGYAGLKRMTASEWNFNTSLSRNLPAGVDGDAAAFNRTRAGANPEYTILRFGTSYIHAFANEWQGRAALSGQYSADKLVPGEQFGIGGPDSVRGYLLREATNDHGYAVQLEGYTPNLAARVGLPDQWRARLVGFYDFGQVKRNDPLAGEQNGKYLASTGVGMRLAYGKTVSLRLDLAHVLRDHGTRQAGDMRLNGALVLVY
jgi:hemolysin activation/secretion protein